MLVNSEKSSNFASDFAKLHKMITFVICIVCLIAGYFIYGGIIERIAEPDKDKKTPCYTMQDGVDYTPMPTWKVFLIQFLNIAGTGPIFGTIQGILFGPAAYLWIVLGCIFGGAVHDYMSGMISLKRNGASLPEIIGDELGTAARASQRFLALFLMILVVAVFVKTPAGLLNSMTGDVFSLDGYTFWLVAIFGYYLIAAILPINKVIGKIYPVFGVVLIFMAVCIFFGIFMHDSSQMPEITEAFENHYPGGKLPIFPALCITIACGAVSGFHATQSPMMARCLKNERMGRRVFYGAMITEGLIAMVWAAAAIQFASNLDVAGDTPYEKLLAAMQEVKADGSTTMNPAILVNMICNTWLGKIGALLAILGVVFAPITTGDTALRSARLIIGDMLKFRQDSVVRRVMLCIPIFAISTVLLFVKFDILWRYFAWFNQTFSIFTFFAISVYLAKKRKPYLITLLPGLFMLFVCVTYICIDANSFAFDQRVSYGIGLASVLFCAVWFFQWKRNTVDAPVRLSFVPSADETSRIVKEVETLLQKHGLSAENIHQTILSLKELLVIAQESTKEGQKVMVSVCRSYHKVSVQISYRGTEIDIPAILNGIDTTDIEEAYGPEAENAIRELLQRSQGERISSRYSKGTNTISILAFRNDRATLIDTILALCMGICVGAIVRMVFPHDICMAITGNAFLPLYSLFFNAIKMIMLPLVFFSIATSLSGISDFNSLGRIGLKTMVVFLITTILAVAITYGISTSVSPGEFGAMAHNFGNGNIAVTSAEVMSEISNIMPSTFLNTFVQSEMIQLIFIAVLIGIVSGSLGKYSQPVTYFIECANVLFAKITTLIIRCMPIAVFGAMANTVIVLDISSMMSIISWAGVCVASFAAMIVVYVIMLSVFANVNPVMFFKVYLEAIFTAMSTSSSSATLPASMNCCRNLGISPRIYSFSIPLGATVNMDGTSIFYTSMVLFLATVCGVTIEAPTMLTLIFTIILLSIASPALPGAALACGTVLLSIAGIPTESIALMLCFNPIIEPLTTALNVAGDGVVTAVVANSEEDGDQQS